MANTKKLTRADVAALRNAVILAAAALKSMVGSQCNAAKALARARRELNYSPESVNWVYRAYQSVHGVFPDDPAARGFLNMIVAKARLRTWLSDIEG